METLYISQKFFSILGKFNVTNDQDEIVYIVEGQWSWAKKLAVYDSSGQEVGLIKGVFWSWLPRFEVWIHGQKVGEISQMLSFLHPKYDIQFMGWKAIGNLIGWNYTITDQNGNTIGTISEKPFHLASYYVIEYENPADALPVLMLVLAIDSVQEAAAAASSGAA